MSRAKAGRTENGENENTEMDRKIMREKKGGEDELNQNKEKRKKNRTHDIIGPFDRTSQVVNK